MTETGSTRVAGRIAGLATAVLAAGSALLAAPVPAASAQPCPDVDVVFARGTGEPPGVGGVGQAFVDAVRAQVGSRSVDVYPVNYAASSNFAAGVDFARTVVDGIRDAGDHIQSEAANCPNTKIVLGGYSQGAALAGFVTSAAVPETVPAAFRSYIPRPLPPNVADHVAAVVLLGEPSDQFMTENGLPAVTIGAPYAPKTLNLCAEGDAICDGTPGGGPTLAHALYGVNGMTAQAAAFVAGRL